MEFAAIKSSLGHAEAGAGAMSILHTVLRLTQAATRSMTHLRTINTHVSSILAAQDKGCNVSLPKQAAPGQRHTDMLMGISSFAFQVRRLCPHHQRYFLIVICKMICLLLFRIFLCIEAELSLMVLRMCRARMHTCCCMMNWSGQSRTLHQCSGRERATGTPHIHMPCCTQPLQRPERTSYELKAASRSPLPPSSLNTWCVIFVLCILRSCM